MINKCKCGNLVMERFARCSICAGRMKGLLQMRLRARNHVINTMQNKISKVLLKLQGGKNVSSN